MEQVFWLSVVTGSIAFTLTESKLFYSFREWVSKRSKFIGKLVNCGYCTGHWIAFALTAIYQPRLFNSWGFLDYFFTALVIAWFAGFQWVLMSFFMMKAGK